MEWQRTLDVDHALVGRLDGAGDGVPLWVLVDHGRRERNLGQAVSGKFKDLWLCWGRLRLLRILEVILL